MTLEEINIEIIRLKALRDKILYAEKDIKIIAIKTFVEQIIDDFDKFKHRNVSDWLSDITFLEGRYASVIFKKSEGITLEKYIIQQKIKKIKDLMFSTSLTLTEIAYKLGYKEVAHLSQQFKKYEKMSCKQWKEERITFLTNTLPI